RTYPCKACGGDVRVPEPEEPKPAIPCAECGAWNDAEDAFCVECGAPLATKPSKGGGVRKPMKPKRSFEERKERLHASQELKAARRSLFIARAILGVWAAFLFVSALIVALHPRSLFRDVPLEEAEVMGWIACALFMFFGALMSALIYFLPRAPFVLGVSAASFFTVLVLLGMIASHEEGDGRFRMRQLTPVVLLWAAVVPLSRVRRLQRDFPDLFSARSWGGGSGRLHSDGISSSRAKAERVRAQQNRQAWKLRAAVVGGIAVVLGGSGFFYLMSKRPDPLPPVLAEFERAWSTSDTEALKPFFSPSLGRKVERWLERREVKNDWGEGWPRLEDPIVEERRDGRPYVV
ncbi:MAG: hypothetical protein AAF368_19815, partial [Planctomycetota bacterium]